VRAGNGIKYATEKMQFYRDKALKALDAFPESEYKTSFIDLVKFTVDRER
jgi:octaprenyl-diphosphate synthase